MKFAASLPDIAYRRLEIWRGETMIYERLNPRTTEPRPEFASQLRALLGEGRIRADIVILGIVDRRFRVGGQDEHSLLPLLDLTPKPAFGHRKGRLALEFRLSLDQVGQALGLSQVDPAILKSATREFAGIRGPKPSNLGQRAKHGIHHRSTAMTLELDDVLAGRACRAVETQD